MKIIELQPGNRVKLLIAPNFKWRPNGPLQRYFEEKVQTEFFNSPFEGSGEIRIFSSGSLSKDANAEVLSKIKHLVKELNGLIKDSEALPGDQRVVTSMVIALRPWEVKVFRDLRRSQNGKVL
jgi:hypothetical protein